MTNVLIIDDDELIGNMLREELTEEGFSALYAASADEGLDILLSKKIDILLLDLKMPGKDGFFVLKEISDLKVNVKVIVITAYSDARSAVEAARLGASDFFLKPFDFGELLSAIRKLSIDKHIE